ncbi:MAG: NADH-quinone oxidoreductase subunit C [Candidatus Poseidoniia archaeon]|nr:NADH-quinone oxidoreductase subunit C [Candidatus Poseidoniia archaeon]|tara:strand:- start:3 stop:482 length:480 start_codon:yes stop_codon:yes gene_type:complete
MEIKAFMKEVSSVKGVTKVGLVRNNVVKCNLDKEGSKDFFVKLKDDFGFEHCSLITAIDNQPQFELVYHFSAINGSVFVKDSSAAVMAEIHIFLDRDTPTVESISDLWFGANWHEREAFDLMGIYFIGHPDLRRVLLPEGFAGHPLRKDYVYEIHEEEW